MSAPAVCEDCDMAKFVLHHGFRMGCLGCCARAASRSPQYRKARDTGMQQRDYRALLDQFGLTHQQVREAAANDAINAPADAAAVE